MQNFIVADNYAIDEAKRHVLFHHHQTLGWITLANRNVIAPVSNIIINYILNSMDGLERMFSLVRIHFISPKEELKI